MVREGWKRVDDQPHLQPMCSVVVGSCRKTWSRSQGTEGKGRKMGNTLKRSWTVTEYLNDLSDLTLESLQTWDCCPQVTEQ